MDPNVSTEYALQAVKWCSQNDETEALNAILKTHFKDIKLSNFPNECTEILYAALASSDSSAFDSVLHHVDTEFLNQKFGREQKTYLTKLLCSAVENGKKEKIDILVERGADVNVAYQGKPILHLALDLGRTEVAKALVEAGANLSAVDRRGNGVLVAAIMSSNKQKADLVKLLICKGADPYQKSGSGKYPLHTAATSSVEVVDALIQAGYDINIRDEVHGDTPLHYACSSCCQETIARLIQCGATFNLVNKRGETPLHKLLRFAVDFHNFHAKTRLEVARKLISIGFKMVPNDSNLQMSKRRGRDKVSDLYIFLKSSMLNAPTLQSIARAELRQTLSSADLVKAIDVLEIPRHLKSYMLFKDDSIGL